MQYYVYIATNYSNRVFYTGVTNDLIKRMYEHRSKLVDGFTRKYNVNKLVYYEIFNDINEAIRREKKIKGGSRNRKFDLIFFVNQSFEDLYGKII